MTDTNVVTLPGVDLREHYGEPNPDLIRALEATLEKARSGELQSLVGTGFCADGSRLSLWAPTYENVYSMMGALVWLQHEYEYRTTLHPRSRLPREESESSDPTDKGA